MAVKELLGLEGGSTLLFALILLAVGRHHEHERKHARCGHEPAEDIGHEHVRIAALDRGAKVANALAQRRTKR